MTTDTSLKTLWPNEKRRAKRWRQEYKTEFFLPPFFCLAFRLFKREEDVRKMATEKWKWPASLDYERRGVLCFCPGYF
jgi:hypothetical protein